jgi:dolichol-phosphate mannosyltransferase
LNVQPSTRPAFVGSVHPAPGLSIVVPCYNEAPNIALLYARLVAAADPLERPYEIVLIDDGSRDGTWSLIADLTERDPRVVGVKLSRNHGHQLALSAGLSVCAGERILVIDADLQDPPELLPDMMARMDEGYDVVYGQRTDREGETAFKKITAHLFYRLIARLVDVPIPVDTGDFRLVSRRALDTLNAMPERHRFIRGMVSWIGYPQIALPYRRAARNAGETKYPLKKMIQFSVDAITSFSIVPLRVASFLGVGAALLAMVVAAYALASWMSGEAVQGWTSLMVITLMLGGAQLLVLGLMGEYLGRLYIESKGRPLFVIEELRGR